MTEQPAASTWFYVSATLSFDTKIIHRVGKAKKKTYSCWTMPIDSQQ